MLTALRLKNLGPLMPPPRRFPIFEYPALKDWVDATAHLVVVGAAAHPIPAGSSQYYAMGVEDGAVLAKLFSHLHTQDQISQFLYAFQDLRQPRCETVATGAHRFEVSDGGEETPEWEEIKTVFGCEAEDEADNWWVSWGLPKQRSLGTSIDLGTTHVQVVKVQ
ncbi:hypothetical protein K438DRAFT_1989644 [Mycena galopus ATCC 62051]|nr:hypothetical protein K438DRAFT_1989644 [Mycena galopus ATCC 62051]